MENNDSCFQLLAQIEDKNGVILQKKVALKLFSFLGGFRENENTSAANARLPTLKQLTESNRGLEYLQKRISKVENRMQVVESLRFELNSVDLDTIENIANARNASS